MSAWIWAVAGTGLVWALAYRESGRWTWTLCLGGFLLLASFLSAIGLWKLTALWTVSIGACVVVLLPKLRRSLISDPLFHWFKRAMPQVSQTEQEALNAGTVWWDADLFSGRPDWRKLLKVQRPALSAEERAFLDGPVETLCRMTDDWEASYELNDQRP